MNGGNFLPMDCIMDLYMLLSVQLTFGRLHLRRLLAAFLLLRGCTAAVLLLRLQIPPVLHLFVFISAAVFAAGAHSLLSIALSTACMICSGAAAAGFSLLGKPALAYALSGGLLILLLMRRQRNISCRWNIDLNLERDGLCARFPALIDTGNRLHEHRSGLPVLIVESGAIPAVDAHVQRLPENEKCTLPFGVLGGGGQISCFRADRVTIDVPGRSPVPAPDCWVGVYPGRIPGAACALAPPEFADALSHEHFIPSVIRDRARRFCYVVFKR